MRDFSIDLNHEKIYSNKTREYFNDVIKAYYNESYRSAIVILYSITIADLVFKLVELKEIYNDSNAIEILGEIEKMQISNPSASEWEKKTFKSVLEKTNLLEISDYNNIKNLQELRHLCAHPVLSQNYELYSPNKETTRAYIRNILEGLLTKPPMLSRKIFDDLLEDLALVKNIFYNDLELEKHLKSKFFDKLNEATILKIFKSLWKISFKIENSTCDKNREINIRTLNILLKNYYSSIIRAIANDKDSFSDINTSLINNIIDIFNKYHAIFNELNDSVKLLITNIIKKDADMRSYAIFLSESSEKHISMVQKIGWNSGYDNYQIKSKTLDYLYQYLVAEGNKDIANDFVIEIYGNSDQYEVADSRFDNLIQKNLQYFTKENFKKLLKLSNANSQIYDRRKASSSFNIIKREIINRIDDNFDFTKYKNLE